jgi:hypothetical protein
MRNRRLFERADSHRHGRHFEAFFRVGLISVDGSAGPHVIEAWSTFGGPRWSVASARYMRCRSLRGPKDVIVAQASVLSHDGSDTLTRSVAKATATDIYGNVLNSAGF